MPKKETSTAKAASSAKKSRKAPAKKTLQEVRDLLSSGTLSADQLTALQQDIQAVATVQQHSPAEQPVGPPDWISLFRSTNLLFHLGGMLLFGAIYVLIYQLFSDIMISKDAIATSSWVGMAIGLVFWAVVYMQRRAQADTEAAPTGVVDGMQQALTFTGSLLVIGGCFGLMVAVSLNNLRLGSLVLTQAMFLLVAGGVAAIAALIHWLASRLLRSNFLLYIMTGLLAGAMTLVLMAPIVAYATTSEVPPFFVDIFFLVATSFGVLVAGLMRLVNHLMPGRVVPQLLDEPALLYSFFVAFFFSLNVSKYPVWWYGLLLASQALLLWYGSTHRRMHLVNISAGVVALTLVHATFRYGMGFGIGACLALSSLIILVTAVAVKIAYQRSYTHRLKEGKA